MYKIGSKVKAYCAGDEYLYGLVGQYFQASDTYNLIIAGKYAASPIPDFLIRPIDLIELLLYF